MNSIRAKLTVAGLILVGAVGYLSYAGAKSGWVYYVDVDNARDTQVHNSRVRLHGKVGTEGFDARPGRLSARFNLLGKTQTVLVDYRGTIPDQFAVGREVVTEGKFDPAGVFQADLLMTKCASKYESNSPHSKEEGGK